MTITDQALERPETRAVALDLYRDIHKGIRAELFAVTSLAGSIDPSDDAEIGALAGHVDSVVDLLFSHAAHEDEHIQPAIEQHLPDLAARIASDHESLERRMTGLRALAPAVFDVPAAERRSMTHHCYLEIAGFTGVYLAHQDVEERLVMPGLEAAIGFDAVLAIHESIIASIPPDEMSSSLAVMLPAMNVDDRAELLGGMRAGAPPEVFAGVWSLTGSLLPPSDHRSLAARLELD